MNENSNKARISLVLAIVAALAAAIALVLGFAGSGATTVAGRSHAGLALPDGPTSTSSMSSSTAARPAHSGSHAAPRRPSASAPSAPSAPSMPSTGPHAPAPVVHVSASLRGPIGYDSFCPAVLDYDATISVDHVPADVTYVWQDGTATGAATVHVTHSPLRLTRALTASASTSGTVSLQVIAPQSVSTNAVHFTTTCISESVGSATTDVPAYTGDCSRGITFTTSVPVTVTNGPLLVHYRWLRSDGGVSTVRTATFGPGTSTQMLSTTWRRWASLGGGAPETAWEQLQLLDGPGALSNQSTFSIWCV